MKISSASASALAIAFASTTFGAYAADMTDTAKVLSARPIIERITDVSNDCSRDSGRRARAPAPEQERSLVGPIVGGIAGAILGKQVGKGNGNVIATAGGAVAGAVIGDRIGNRPSAPPPQYEDQPCRRVETSRDVVKGYSVVYRYNGRDATTTLPYDPGDRITVGVTAIQER